MTDVTTTLAVPPPAAAPAAVAATPLIRKHAHTSQRNHSSAFLLSVAVQTYVDRIKHAVRNGTRQFVWQDFGRTVDPLSPYHYYGCDFIVCAPHLNPSMKTHLP